MPRGVYDRSKMKKKTAEAKDDSAPASPKKYGKRQVKAQTLAHPAAQQAATGIGGTNRFFELQTAINTLTNTRSVANASHINGILDPILTKAVQEYGEHLFPVVKKEEAVSKNGAATAPVAAPVATAPVPFNPPTFAPAQS